MLKPRKMNPVLIDVKNILLNFQDKNRWCKRAIARDKDGEQLFSPTDPNAVSWCILGVAYGLGVSDNTISFLKNCARQIGYSDIDRFNDFNEYSDIILFLKKCEEALYKYRYEKEDEK
jgi:hypothetical protein